MSFTRTDRTEFHRREITFMYKIRKSTGTNRKLICTTGHNRAYSYNCRQNKSDGEWRTNCAAGMKQRLVVHAGKKLLEMVSRISFYHTSQASILWTHTLGGAFRKSSTYGASTFEQLHNTTTPQQRHRTLDRRATNHKATRTTNTLQTHR